MKRLAAQSESFLPQAVAAPRQDLTEGRGSDGSTYSRSPSNHRLFAGKRMRISNLIAARSQQV